MEDAQMNWPLKLNTDIFHNISIVKTTLRENPKCTYELPGKVCKLNTSNMCKGN